MTRLLHKHRSLLRRDHDDLLRQVGEGAVFSLTSVICLRQTEWLLAFGMLGDELVGEDFAQTGVLFFSLHECRLGRCQSRFGALRDRGDVLGWLGGTADLVECG